LDKEEKKFILTKENYFSQEASKEYMSVSQYKSFLTCEAAALAEINGEYEREQKDALLFGQCVHAWNEGILDDFKMNHPEMFKKDGSIYAKFHGVDECIDAIKNDSTMMEYLTGQKEVMFTAELFGVPWKILIDCYCPEKGRFTDLKIMRDVTTTYYNRDYKVYTSFVDNYKYNLQMIIYAEIEKRATGREDYLEPFLAIVTKESPPDKLILNGFKEEILFLLSEVEYNMPRIIKVKNGIEEPTYCGKCDYCRSIKNVEVMNYRELPV
jgi:hypothetical protein